MRARFGDRLRHVASSMVRLAPAPLAYRLRSLAERFAYDRTPVIHDLPPIFHYWSDARLRPRFQALGFRSPDDFLLRELAELAAAGARRCVSLGAGRCETELSLARRLRDDFGHSMHFVCIDLNPRLLAAAAAEAEAAGVSAMFEFVSADVRALPALGRADAVIANQCLHHFVELEAVFDAVHSILDGAGLFLVCDVIGRNGHRMWPEALAELQTLWRTLPERLRIDRRSGRALAEYDNADYSDVGFEGIRAQDILPLLVERFEFDVFAPFACIVIPFIDRRFGANYDIGVDEDRSIVDRIADRDEALLGAGTIKPTQLVAALRTGTARRRLRMTPFEPHECIRHP